MTFGATGLVWGAILAALLIGYAYLSRRAGLSNESRWQWALYGLPPLAALAAQLAWRRAGAALAYADGIALGGIVILCGTIAYGVFVFGYCGWVDDTLIRREREARVRRIERHVTDETKRARAIARIPQVRSPARFAARVTVALLVVGFAALAVLTSLST